MVGIRIPGTNRIVFMNRHIGDYVFDMTNAPEADSSVRNEDIVVVGNWSDYTGSGTKLGQEVMLAGMANEADVISQVNGVNVDKRSDRGNRTSTTRSRTNLVYIEI